jgi:hypothetical protein
MHRRVRRDHAQTDELARREYALRQDNEEGSTVNVTTVREFVRESGASSSFAAPFRQSDARGCA